MIATATHYQYTRRYTGPVKAVICDWAGTTIDFGSRAPIIAFLELFKKHGVMATEAQAREPMGTEKSVHIRQMLVMPEISEQWKAAKGAEPVEADVQALYEEFLPLQLATIRQCGELIPGWLTTVTKLRQQGIQLGGNTGYNTEMYGQVKAVAKELGYEADVNVCATEVSKGRPYPYMAQAVMEKLGVLEAQACIKVDDTETGIEEGLNAGMWTVGVAVSGNANGLSLAQWDALNAETKESIRLKAHRQMALSGAHYVIDSVADLPAVVDNINARLAAGQQP
ncbi:phosphonoacetaldehyde hydrolase [Amphritea sp. 2_MG-2023]|uniref:phosphonoacetaldehyde hydrolase n=1 Tax=Amphritea TaxID=515417 RepID=UPI001C07AD92|nr:MULTISPECIES: phosphonoacetaldehyde hydrolase [Amphritea]MBU2964113.1 phosphonoacetaldehyde hydrolase [Amphritea atlantica]MDO6418511.1 phosphonoacetaldehyde hydrolase [Amphritea sp. 2_MG-2023]